MTTDQELEREIKLRLADKYTAAEFCELVDIPVEDLIETYWDQIPSYMLREVT